MEQTNRMTLTDDSGQEREVEIVLTFDAPEGSGYEGISYVLFKDPEDPEETVYACRYDHEGNMEAVSEEAEWEMCAQVLDASQTGVNENDG